jgi:hypothetical protein
VEDAANEAADAEQGAPGEAAEAQGMDGALDDVASIEDFANEEVPSDEDDIFASDVVERGRDVQACGLAHLCLQRPSRHSGALSSVCSVGHPLEQVAVHTAEIQGEQVAQLVSLWLLQACAPGQWLQNMLGQADMTHRVFYKP